MTTSPVPDTTTYAPIGQLIEVDGHTRHLCSQGAGTPSVVMEAAIWDVGLTWSLVQPEVAKFTRAITYDRAGYGWSAPSPKPRHGEALIEELYILLQAAGVPAPYILVGQSFSGMLIRLFAYHYPREVAGLVLIDSAHEDQDRRFPEAIQAMAKAMAPAQLAAIRQMRDLVQAQGSAAAPPFLPVPPQMPNDVADLYRALLTSSVTRLETMANELECLEETRAQVRAARDRGLGDIPLIVMSHGIPQSIPGMPDDVNREYEATWQQLQTELTALSTYGKHIVAENAGHMIHHDRPDLVTEAIREVVQAARSGTSLNEREAYQQPSR